MNTVTNHRQRGFRYRRLSFSLKSLSVLWAVSMLGVFFTDMSWLNFFIAVTGLIAFCTPAILLAATFDTFSDKEFMKAAAAAHTPPSPLLGVVSPRKLGE